MKSHSLRFLTVISPLLLLVTAFLWIRGHYARDGIWYSTDSMRYSIHSYRGRIWLWSLSIAPDPSAMVWGSNIHMSKGFQVDSVADSWYGSYIGPSKGVQLETDFTEAPGGWSGSSQQWLGFRYISTDTWYPKAQLQFGYPTARSRAIFVPHWAIAIVTAILPALSIISLIRNRNRRDKNLCPHCGYDLRATPGRCPECGRESSPAQ